MKTKIEMCIHKRYAKVVVRFTRDNTASYTEYALSGVDVFEYLKMDITSAELEKLLAQHVEAPNTVRDGYLKDFKGMFMHTYYFEDNVRAFDSVEARHIDSSTGSRNVIGAFKDKTFKDKIFFNTIEGIVTKDVNKLNGIMAALRSIGG